MVDNVVPYIMVTRPCAKFVPPYVAPPAAPEFPAFVPPAMAAMPPAFAYPAKPPAVCSEPTPTSHYKTTFIPYPLAWPHH